MRDGKDAREPERGAERENVCARVYVREREESESVRRGR